MTELTGDFNMGRGIYGTGCGIGNGCIAFIDRISGFGGENLYFLTDWDGGVHDSRTFRPMIVVS